MLNTNYTETHCLHYGLNNGLRYFYTRVFIWVVYFVIYIAAYKWKSALQWYVFYWRYLETMAQYISLWKIFVKIVKVELSILAWQWLDAEEIEIYYDAVGFSGNQRKTSDQLHQLHRQSVSEFSFSQIFRKNQTSFWGSTVIAGKAWCTKMLLLLWNTRGMYCMWDVNECESAPTVVCNYPETQKSTSQKLHIPWSFAEKDIFWSSWIGP